MFRDARCVLALHNLAHQGSHPPAAFDGLGVPGEWYGAMEWVDTGAGGAAGGGGGGQGAAGGARRPTINVLKVGGGEQGTSDVHVCGEGRRGGIREAGHHERARGGGRRAQGLGGGRYRTAGRARSGRRAGMAWDDGRRAGGGAVWLGRHSMCFASVVGCHCLVGALLVAEGVAVLWVFPSA